MNEIGVNELDEEGVSRKLEVLDCINYYLTFIKRIWLVINCNERCWKD